jgi:hypothetical protein
VQIAWERALLHTTLSTSVSSNYNLPQTRLRGQLEQSQLEQSGGKKGFSVFVVLNDVRP